MAVVASVSSPANGTVAVNALLTALVANGYIVKRWSDATTLSADNVNLTSNPYVGNVGNGNNPSGSGANSLGNSNAWFRVAASDGSREWLFQRGAADQTWTISRSNSAFTGGTPNATTAGTSTAASALFSAAQAFPSTGTWRQFISVENAAPYGFTVFGITLGGGNVLQFLVDEPLASGTTDTSDTDPYIWWGYYNATGLAGATGGINALISSNIFKRFTGAGSNQTPSLPGYNTTANGTMAPAQTSSISQMGLTPNTLREVILPIFACRPGASSSTTGWIGTCNRLRWGTVGGRANGQTLGPVSGSYWIFMAGAWVPWDSTEPALS